MNTKIIGIVVALVALLGVAGFVLMNKLKEPVMVTTIPEVRQVGTLPEGKKTVVEVTVTGKDFSFEPKDVTVHEGDVVTVTFKNEGHMMHDWVVEGENIATKTVNGGQADVIQFVAPKKGSYETFCSVSSHRKMGMVGKLIVQ